jgi:hypothetical protein
MIRPLRQRHRLMLLGLSVALPLLFGAGLLARKAPAVMEALPATGRVPEAGAYPLVVAEREADSLAVQIRLRADGRPARRLALELMPRQYLKEPDLLVYWHPGTASDVSPSGGYLLGAMDGARARIFALPDTARHTNGTVIFYTLAHQKTLETATLE